MIMYFTICATRLLFNIMCNYLIIFLHIFKTITNKCLANELILIVSIYNHISISIGNGGGILLHLQVTCMSLLHLQVTCDKRCIDK